MLDRDLWRKVVTLLYGSIEDVDMHVQVEIWQKVLLGDCPLKHMVEDSEDEDGDEDEDETDTEI